MEVKETSGAVNRIMLMVRAGRCELYSEAGVREQDSTRSVDNIRKTLPDGRVLRQFSLICIISKVPLW
ncbi:hypothetical protein E2C01_003382 [Portunus trituberculatus]|uniref:Uncharacterized protein n=1 Tax=Portunus trituberculatus TaxID=210409 RepID=A0A5B7CM29_PORTR|nr:hypothetical protein [Portunus trituberculatus]